MLDDTVNNLVKTLTGLLKAWAAGRPTSAFRRVAGTYAGAHGGRPDRHLQRPGHHAGNGREPELHLCLPRLSPRRGQAVPEAGQRRDGRRCRSRGGAPPRPAGGAGPGRPSRARRGHGHRHPRRARGQAHRQRPGHGGHDRRRGPPPGRGHAPRRRDAHGPHARGGGGPHGPPGGRGRCQRRLHPAGGRGGGRGPRSSGPRSRARRWWPRRGPSGSACWATWPSAAAPPRCRSSSCAPCGSGCWPPTTWSAGRSTRPPPSSTPPSPRPWLAAEAVARRAEERRRLALAPSRAPPPRRRGVARPERRPAPAPAGDRRGVPPGRAADRHLPAASGPACGPRPWPAAVAVRVPLPEVREEPAPARSGAGPPPRRRPPLDSTARRPRPRRRRCPSWPRARCRWSTADVPAGRRRVAVRPHPGRPVPASSPSTRRPSAGTAHAPRAVRRARPVDPVVGETALEGRDDLLDNLEAGLTRALKRVLGDEQNEVLDGLRRLGAVRGRHGPARARRPGGRLPRRRRCPGCSRPPGPASAS